MAAEFSRLVGAILLYDIDPSTGARMRGPKDSDAVDFDRFSMIPGERRTWRQKRKLIAD